MYSGHLTMFPKLCVAALLTHPKAYSIQIGGPSPLSSAWQLPEYLGHLTRLSDVSDRYDGDLLQPITFSSYLPVRHLTIGALGTLRSTGSSRFSVEAHIRSCTAASNRLCQQCRLAYDRAQYLNRRCTSSTRLHCLTSLCNIGSTFINTPRLATVSIRAAARSFDRY